MEKYLQLMKRFQITKGCLTGLDQSFHYLVNSACPCIFYLIANSKFMKDFEASGMTLLLVSILMDVWQFKFYTSNAIREFDLCQRHVNHLTVITILDWPNLWQ